MNLRFDIEIFLRLLQRDTMRKIYYAFASAILIEKKLHVQV